MSDWMLLYLFTRLDAFTILFVIAALIGGALTAMLCAIYFGHGCEPFDDEEMDAKFLRWLRAIACGAALSAVMGALIPSQKDMAIIVGGSLAIDAARSDDAKEIAGEVMAAIRAKLREAAKE